MSDYQARVMMQDLIDYQSALNFEGNEYCNTAIVSRLYQKSFNRYWKLFHHSYLVNSSTLKKYKITKLS